jgi:hypothetical protein
MYFIKNFFKKKVLTKLNLEDLLNKYGSDQARIGNIEYYKIFFEKFKYSKFDFLEIGIGGHNLNKVDNKVIGNSLYAWADFFLNAHIHGIDIHDKSFLDKSRIKTYKGDQSDEYFLETVLKKFKNLMIVCDDGSHIPSHQIKSFEKIFPYLKENGIYCITDLEYSYSKIYADTNPNHKNNVMNFFFNLSKYINSDIISDDFLSQKKYSSIKSIHFCHSLIIIEKGKSKDKQIKYLKMLNSDQTLKSEKGDIKFDNTDKNYLLQNDFGEYNFFTDDPNTFFEEKFKKNIVIIIELPEFKIKKMSFIKSIYLDGRLPKKFLVKLLHNEKLIENISVSLNDELNMIDVILNNLISINKVIIEVLETFDMKKICRIEKIQFFDENNISIMSKSHIGSEEIEKFKVNIQLN